MTNPGTNEWRQKLKSASPGCWKYRTILDEAARACGAADDPEAELVRALAEVSALVIDEHTSNEPMRPVFPTASRGVALFDEHELDVMRDAAAELPADLRGRVRDLLWIRRRGRAVADARAMVDDYCDAAIDLAPGTNNVWDSARSRLRRALAVAAMMKNEQGQERVRDTARRILLDPELPGMTRLDAASVLAEWGEQFAREAAEHALALAEAAIASVTDAPTDWDWMRRALQVAADAFARAEDDAAARNARTRRAELWVEQSRWLQKAGASALVRAHLLERALVAYRDLGVTGETVRNVHAELLAVQKQGTQELVRPRGPSHDASAEALEAIEAVSDKPFDEALAALVSLVEVPRVAVMRRFAAENLRRFPLQSLFPIRLMDREGRTVTSRAGSAGDEDPAALTASMHEYARIHHQISVIGRINPARRRIASEHPAFLHQWIEYLADRPLVPPGRRIAVASGLSDGLQGDMVASVSILVPQLEHMLRMVVVEAGGITSSYDAERGEQEEVSLGSILRHEELTRVLGEDLVFDLKGLLDEKTGANLRNRVAHGLLDDGDFMSVEGVYLWYSVLRLVVRVTRSPRGGHDESSSTTA